MTENTTLDYAKMYVEHGISVIPIRKGEKRPAISWTEYQTRLATSNEIEEWFTDEANIGVVTGEVSGNLVILDFDGDGWEIARNDLLREFPDLESTQHVQSGSGKLHIWLSVDDLTDDDGEPLTKSVFPRPDLGEKTQIEVRANGHQTLAPPSIHPNGTEYIFLNDHHVLRVENLDPILDWLTDWEQGTAPSMTSIPQITVPPLLDRAVLPEELGADASPWLDAYIEYSRRWSPRAYDGFYEAIGLWVLSTVAARRVGFHLGKA